MLHGKSVGAMQFEDENVQADAFAVESEEKHAGRLPSWTAAVDPPHQLPSMLHLALLMRTHGYVDPEDDRRGPVRPRLKSLMSTMLFERIARNQSSGSLVLKLLHLIETSSSEPPASFLLSLFHQALHQLVSATNDSSSELTRDVELKCRLLDAILARTLERPPPTSSQGPEAFDLLTFLTQSLAPAIPLGDERIQRINEYFWSHFSSRTDDYLVIMSQWLSHHAILSMYVDEYEWTDIHTMIHTRLPKCMPILHGLLKHVKQSESNRLRFLRHDGLNIATIIHRRVHRGPAWASAIAVELLHICKLPLRLRISSPSGGRAEVAIVDRVRVSSPTVQRPAQPAKRQDTYPPRGKRKPKPKPSESKAAADAKKAKEDQKGSGAKNDKEPAGKTKEEEEAEAAEMTRRRSIRDAREVIKQLRRASVDVPTAADGTGPLRVERNSHQPILPLPTSNQGRRRSSTKDLKGSVIISGNRALEPPVEEGSLENVAEEVQEPEEEEYMDPLERSVSSAIRPILVAMRQGEPWFSPLRRALSFTSESPLSVIEALILVERIHALLVAALDAPKNITMAMLDPNEDPDSDEAARASGDGQAVLVDWDEEIVDRYISGCLAQLRVLIVHMGLVATVANSTVTTSPPGGNGKSTSSSVGVGTAGQKQGRAGSGTSQRPASATSQTSNPSAGPNALARRGTLVSSATPLGTAARRQSTVASVSNGKRASTANASALMLATVTAPTSGAKERNSPVLCSVTGGATIPPLYRLPNAATSTDPQVSIDGLIHHAQVKKRLLELGVSRTLLRILNRSYAVRVLYYAVTLVQIYSVEPEAASELLRAHLGDSRSSHSASSSNGELAHRGHGSANDVFAAFDIGEAISTDSLYGDAISGGNNNDRSSPPKRRLSLSNAPSSPDLASRGRRPSVIEASSMDISSHQTSISITTTPASRRNSIMSRRSSVANPSLLLPRPPGGRRNSVSPPPRPEQQPESITLHSLSPSGSPKDGRRVSLSPLTSLEESSASTPHQAAERLRRGSMSPTLAASARGRSSSPSPSNGRLKTSSLLNASTSGSIGATGSHQSLTGPDAGGGVRERPPETAAILEPLHILRHSGHMGLQRNARAAFWSLCRHGSMTTARTAARLVKDSVWEKVGLE